MVAQLHSAQNGEKAMVISRYAALTGKSSNTLYRIAGKNGYCPERKSRVDKGAIRSGLTRDQLQTVSAMLQTSARQNKGAILPVTEALRICEDSGKIQPGTISAGRLAAHLRDLAMGAKAMREPRPHIHMASLHANHVHVFDGSVCVQYYLKGGGIGIMDERDFNEKKPVNCAKMKKQRLLRMMMVDHFSHYMFVKYYASDGESQLVIFDFLADAWLGGLHEKLPFRGLPKFLLMDAGSANISKSMMHMIKELGIEIPKNMPHNPRRQGSAECAHNIWETHFEARMVFDPAYDVDQLNAATRDYLVWWNSTLVHKRHSETRTNCWLRNVQGHLIDCPARELLQEAFAAPAKTRRVNGDYTISWENNVYRLAHIEGIRPGMTVTAKKRPVLWPQLIIMMNDTEYAVEPVGKMNGGFLEGSAVIGQEYKAQKETPTQKAMKENEQLAFGDAADRKKDAVPFAGKLKVFGHHADKVGAVPMPIKGAPMTVEHAPDLAAREIPIMELFKRLRDAGVKMDAAINADLRAAFGDTATVGMAEHVVCAMTEGRDWRMDIPRIAAVG